MKNILKILRLSKPLHHLVGILGFLILITSLLNLATPIISKFIVDEITTHIQTRTGDLSRLIFFIVFAFSSSIVSVLLTSVSERIGDHFAGRLRKFLTEMFYDKIFTLPQSYFNSELSGKLTHQLNRGIITIQQFMNAMTNFILPTFLQSFLIVAVLALYSLPIAGFILLLFPIYIGISHISTTRWGKEEVKKNAIEDKLRGRIQEVVSNMALVKSFTMEQREFSRTSKDLDAINKIYANQSRTFHVFDFFRGFSLQCILFCVNGIVFYSAFQGTITLGEMVLILQLVNQARIPLFAMSYILTQIQMAESGSKEYLELLSLESKEQYSQKPITIHRFKHPTITFDHVSFAYESSQMILKDICLTLKAPQTVAIVGHSGAGKSTLISLLLKFYEPTQGDILLNGTLYKTFDHATIRRNISLVFQENELFSSTIRDNVAYGNHDATEEDIIHALRLANAHEFVMKLPHGLDTEIGERGVRLSGGQKQRIQIARAILKDAPILILDEATSSLDAKSEKEVQDALENLFKQKLVLIIAHRFSTIQNVDTIIVLHEGKVTEIGTPKELAKKKGIYAELLRYQVEGNKKLLEQYELF
ncbi:MAG: ABC transporter ATP-binding protein/permease [Patescibacteria group bacterium]|nr:ABC transporter ATP-binding protein/permease [Patescibacteria group bacterium]